MDTRAVPLPTGLAEHRIDVSDSHPVASHPLCPTRPRPVYPPSPSPPPCTVTLDDPVDPAVFDRRTELTTLPSADTDAVKLPT